MRNDLIRRQDAIERATKEHDFYKGATIPTDKARRDELLNVMCWLGELPSAQPQQTCEYWDSESKFCALCRPSAQPEPQWIPCSERLPELGQEVLVYAIGKDDGFIGDAVTTISERLIFRLFPSSPGVEEWRSPWVYFDSNYEITHWMPLPEPPKGEKE